MIQVLIADDHSILRRGLTQIVSEENDMKVCAEATTGAQAVRLAREHNVNVVLLDINMPDRNGLDTLKQLKNENPRLAVLILSIHPEENYGVRAIKSGASGYLDKSSAPALLISAIRQVASGRRYISPLLAEALAGTVSSGAESEPHELLSNREFETMRLMAAGRTLSQMAAEMSLSPKTISVYRARVLQKMRLKTNSEVTYYALKNQLMD